MIAKASREEINLYKIIIEIKTEEEALSFLRAMLTDKEFERNQRRWPAVPMLVTGRLSNVEIAKECGLNDRTVAQLNARLNNFGENLKEVLDRSTQ